MHARVPDVALLHACAEPEEWSEMVKVEAWVVTLKNAAAAENVGLLQPLLSRFQAGKLSMMVFGLPAVMVRRPDCSLRACQ